MLATIRQAVKQAYNATKTLQVSVTLTHYSYSAVTDTYLGKTSRTASTQTLSAVVGEAATEVDDGKNVIRCALYVDESALTLTLAADDLAVFNGETWTVERLGEASPQFVRAIHVRRP